MPTRIPKNYAPKVCDACDELYKPRQGDQRYCSPDCRDVGHNARLGYEKAAALRIYRYLQQRAPNALARIKADLGV